MTAYRYTVEGTAADGQTWAVTAPIATKTAGEFAILPDQVMRLALQALSEGKATCGQPGKTCRGPFTITRFLIEHAALRASASY
jgi:hypothetical protein